MSMRTVDSLAGVHGAWHWLLMSLVLIAAPASSQTAINGVSPEIAGLREIQSLDVAADGGRIHILAVAKTGGSVQSELFYTATSDGGRTWRKLVAVGGNGEPVVSRLGNDAQLAVQGLQMAVVWQRGGETPGSGPMALAYSDDGGLTWNRARAPEFDDPTRQQSYLDLAVDSSGRFHMVWLDDREENGNTQGLRHAQSMDGGRSWQEVATVDPAVCTCCWNRLMRLPDGAVTVLYRDDAPHDMKLARWTAAGGWQGWGAVGEFDWDFAGCPHCGGGLAVTRNPRGVVLHSVVWTGKENAAGWYYLATAGGGKTWSAPRRIADAASREADIAAYGEAGLGIVYTRPEGKGSAVYHLHSDDGGKSWERPRRISTEAASADHPRILGDAEGGAVVFWTERRAGAGRVLAMARLSDR